MSVLLAAIVGTCIGAIVIGGLGLYYILNRCERAVVWSDDATITDKVSFHYRYAVDHDHHTEFAVILGRGIVIGFVGGIVLYTFGVGFIEVFIR